MVFLFEDTRGARPRLRFLRSGGALSWADVFAFLLLAAAAVLVVHGAGQMSQPLAQLDVAPVVLDPANLPEYALRTTLRMFAALAASLVFTFTVAMLAARSRKAEMVIIPALDILQSVPVLGFLTFTVTFFMGLFPGRQLGAECAAIFAIFTSQAWNMAFSFYQSLRTLPKDLTEVSRQFGFSPWLRFVRLEVPFATPGLVWNIMMSMSGGWFFVVASEAITVGDTTVALPGIGSWLALAIAQRDVAAVGWAVAAMAVVIGLYDQLVFRPVVAWADKFRFEQTASQQRPRSWLYDLVRRTRLMRRLLAPFGWPLRWLAAIPRPHLPPLPRLRISAATGRLLDRLWLGVVILAVAWAVWLVAGFIATSLHWSDVLAAFGFGLATLARVVVLIAVASLIWVPIGMWIGLRPAWAGRVQPLAQFLAAFPANVLFPFAVTAIVVWRLDPDIWLSPLMVLGTQWYILFNVIAGAGAIPTDMREAASIYGIRGWQWWRQLGLPGIFPYYVTGALTASGGSWNASIVAEAVSWGDRHVEAAGLGAFIARATEAGDFPRVALGIAVMSIFVIAFNRILWRPLYGFAERRLRID
ncbi:ABC transporter permease [Plastoroseomonas hellenica]|uniref:ABC transporter permease n=1 Tax=Plastoroseomonas hellenica TaxID=2687306 RepID=UPI001BAE2179|nr:ABC transporter permease subunit [Plastoroseomonas hellenica]MBR0642796.1 ABC transporter permease subunit [Plastoroseomonas hellenica]